MPLAGLGARERAAALVLGALLLILAIAAPGFFSPANLRDILMANAAILIIALGMTMVVLTGEVDVSVGATLSAPPSAPSTAPWSARWACRRSW